MNPSPLWSVVPACLTSSHTVSLSLPHCTPPAQTFGLPPDISGSPRLMCPLPRPTLLDLFPTPHQPRGYSDVDSLEKRSLAAFSGTATLPHKPSTPSPLLSFIDSQPLFLLEIIISWLCCCLSPLLGRQLLRADILLSVFTALSSAVNSVCHLAGAQPIWLNEKWTGWTGGDRHGINSVDGIPQGCAADSHFKTPPLLWCSSVFTTATPASAYSYLFHWPYFSFVPAQIYAPPPTAAFTSTPGTVLRVFLQESPPAIKLPWLPPSFLLLRDTYAFGLALGNSVFLVFPYLILSKIVNCSEGGLRCNQFC